MLMLSVSGTAFSDEQSTRADQSTAIAAYLFNFGRFAHWPDSAFSSDTSPVNICGYGDDSLGKPLLDLSTKQLHSRSIEVSLLTRGEPVSRCHILYINESEAFFLNRIIEETAGRPILTVSQLQDFSEKGGIIGLLRVNNRLRFEINEEAADQSGMKLSAQLMKLAKRVLNTGAAN